MTNVQDAVSSARSEKVSPRDAPDVDKHWALSCSYPVSVLDSLTVYVTPGRTVIGVATSAPSTD